MKIINYLKKHSSKQGIIFLQKAHSTKEVDKFWKVQWGGQIMFSDGSNDSRGVLIAFHEGLHFTVEKEINNSKGRIFILKIIIQNSKYLLINLYNANTEQQQVDTIEDVSSMPDQIDLDSEYKRTWESDFNFYFDLSSEAEKLIVVNQASNLCLLQRTLTVDDLLTAQTPHFFNVGSTIFSFPIVFKKTLSRSIFLHL